MCFSCTFKEPEFMYVCMYVTPLRNIIDEVPLAGHLCRGMQEWYNGTRGVFTIIFVLGVGHYIIRFLEL